MQVIRSWFGRAKVDLFAFQETTHCPLWYSMVEPKGDAGVRCPSTRVASGPSILFSPFSSFTSSIDQDSRLTSHSPAQCFRLDQPDMDARSGCIARGGPMASPIQAGNALSGSGAALEPQPWAIQHACLASEWEPSGTLGQGVLTTLQAARAPSTVVIYTGCWEIFTCWCQSKCINPVSCDVLSLIFFFQFLLEAGLKESTLKGYVAAISDCNDHIDGLSASWTFLLTFGWFCLNAASSLATSGLQAGEI